MKIRVDVCHFGKLNWGRETKLRTCFSWCVLFSYPFSFSVLQSARDMYSFRNANSKGLKLAVAGIDAKVKLSCSIYCRFHSFLVSQVNIDHLLNPDAVLTLLIAFSRNSFRKFGPHYLQYLLTWLQLLWIFSLRFSLIWFTRHKKSFPSSLSFIN